MSILTNQSLDSCVFCSEQEKLKNGGSRSILLPMAVKVPDLLGETGWDSGKSRVSPAVPVVDSAGHVFSVYAHL